MSVTLPNDATSNKSPWLAVQLTVESGAKQEELESHADMGTSGILAHAQPVV